MWAKGASCRIRDGIIEQQTWQAFGATNIASFGATNIASFGATNIASFGTTNMTHFGATNTVDS
jgi:hypothetical protein